MILEKDEKEIFIYHENQLSDDNGQQSKIFRSENLTPSVLTVDSQIVIIRFLNVSDRTRYEKVQYFFINLQNNKLIAQINNQGRNCYLVGNDYVVTDRPEDYYRRSEPEDPDQKERYQVWHKELSDRFSEFRISKKIFGANILVTDINKDNRLEISDRLLSEMRHVKLNSTQQKLLTESFDAKNHSIILPTDRNTAIPIGLESVEIIKKKTGKTNEEVVDYLLKTDADNNLMINWADDITMNGQIDEKDYEAIRLLHGFCLNRYGNTLQRENININDVLFGLNSVFGSYQGKLSSARPSEMGFKKNVTIWKKNKTDRYNFRKKYHPDDGTGTLLGSGLGSLLGFAFGGWPGLIGGGLLGGGTGRALGGGYSENWTQKDVEYYRYDKEQDKPVNIVMFKTKNNYCVFILDASSSISEETTTTIISEYEEGKLKPTSKEEIKKSWLNVADHKTSGRISVYDQTRKIQVNYQNDQFLGIFSQKFSEYQENDVATVKTMIKPFTEAKDQVTKILLWQLNQIACNLRNFQPEETFQNGNELLKDVAKNGGLN